jgi:NADH-quinone oxidoreductase subunit N
MSHGLSNLNSLYWFSPESVLTGGILLILIVDLVARRPSRRLMGALTLLTLLGSLVATLVTRPGRGPVGLFGGLIARDPFADFFKIFFAITTAIVGIMALRAKDAIDYDDHDKEAAEFFALALSVALGMNLMAASTDLLLAYLSLEFVSIMSYIMAGFTRRSRRSAEASLKYVIYGGVASGVMLYGMSILYGIAGTTDLVQIRLAAATANPVAVFTAVAFCMAGFGYKIASVPFHMWCPDVYEGAPTPVTAFLSVGPKAAGFALLMRFFHGAMPSEVASGSILPAAPWALMLASMSAVTMTLGNLAAIGQQNLKRMLAYSSIAHAGYLLMGFATGTPDGQSAILFYLVAYLLMNLGAFLVILAISEAGLGESIDDYKGLGYRSPYHAVVLSIFLISLTGVPPMVGFVGKFYLFAALLNKGGSMFVALAVIGVLNSAISLYYYARVLKAMYLDAPVRTEPVQVARQHTVLLAPLAALTLLFGFYWSPIYNWVSGSLGMWLPQVHSAAAALLK